jgi:signal transduction histidine kinase
MDVFRATHCDTGPVTRADLARVLRRPFRWDWAVDAIMAIALAVGTMDAAWRQRHEDGVLVKPLPPGVRVTFRPTNIEPHQLMLAGLTALPLVFRRRYPLATFWAVIIVTLLFHRDLQPPPGFGSDDTTLYTFVACLIAGYSALTYSTRRAAAVASVIAGAILLSIGHDANVPSATPGYVSFIVLVGVGLVVHTLRTWKQRVQTLESEREAATRQAVDAERARIARELHDVVTHNVSVMVVQAGAARKVLDSTPDRARDALLAVEASGRSALTELRHVMGLLTSTPDDAPDFAPQPGLRQLSTLTGRVRDTGVPVELTVTGTPGDLPPGAELATYRVVQEALTNAVKHAAGSSVRVTVDYRADAVLVEVTDTGGTPTVSAQSGSGRGLIGLRERLAVYGGTLQAGIRPTGGYRVQAEIPVIEP